MELDSLYILNYRNIQQADLNFSARINCLVGSNGMGKTNILDAIYYLSFCKSAWAQSDQMVIRHGQDCMMIRGTYDSSSVQPVDISCTAKLHGRKQFKRQGKEYRKFSEHIGSIPLVMISPSDMELITGGSEDRRRFMDLVISQYDKEYLNRLIEYNKALTQRNAMLKADAEPSAELMSMWEAVMDMAAQKIHKSRCEFTDRLIPYFQELYSEIGVMQETVGLNYSSHMQRGSLLQQLEEGRARDRAAGYTLHGIHKDDLEMTLGGFPIRKEGSQGQNKSFLVALKLAQAVFMTEVCSGKKPLLLLDDLFDRLDSQRVSRILKLVASERFGQTFITDTDRSHLDSVLSSIGQDYKLFTVSNGEVS